VDFRRWYNGYAATSWTPDEAQEAVAHVPSPLKPTQASRDDYLLGRVFALADNPRATHFFARAAHSCSIEDDFYRTKAKLELASRAPEQACSLYADIVAHWGSAPTNVTATEAARRAKSEHCPRNTTIDTREANQP
jgi:hypothetical protein